MNYISKQDYELKERVMKAEKFLKTNDNVTNELLDFLDTLANNTRMKKYVRTDIFCSIMNWFIEKDFLPAERGLGRVNIASDLSAWVVLKILNRK